LIEILARSKKPTEGLSGTRAELAESLAEIRNQGYATVNRSRPIADDVTISVPVALEERVLAGLTIRYTASALPLPAAVGRFVPKLRECANKIRNVFAEQQAEARRKDASAAVN
jgi:DNA-binding IclR family transcriptional regulator